VAEPENVIGLPGATVIGAVAVGGFTIDGAVIVTDGAMPLVLTTHWRS
jgi:hypothetical protein